MAPFPSQTFAAFQKAIINKETRPGAAAGATDKDIAARSVYWHHAVIFQWDPQRTLPASKHLVYLVFLCFFFMLRVPTIPLINPAPFFNFKIRT